MPPQSRLAASAQMFGTHYESDCGSCPMFGTGYESDRSEQPHDSDEDEGSITSELSFRTHLSVHTLPFGPSDDEDDDSSPA